MRTDPDRAAQRERDDDEDRDRDRDERRREKRTGRDRMMRPRRNR